MPEVLLLFSYHLSPHGYIIAHIPEIVYSYKKVRICFFIYHVINCDRAKKIAEKQEVFTMKNYTKINIGNEGRVELHDKLALTGAEISINRLPAGAGIPFVHSHRNNEEIYGILSGKGKAVVDGEETELNPGDWLRISPATKRQFFAAADSGITYVCIQVKENSLEKFTADDAVVY